MDNFTIVKNNPQVLEFLRQTRQALKNHAYTDHGIDHAELVAARARSIARQIGLSDNEQELSAMAGFCHDMANFLSRKLHHYLGAMLFQQIFGQVLKPTDLAVVMQAIASHDKYEMEFASRVSAVLVIADKSDVRRSRVIVKDKKLIVEDIHNRVNFATKSSKIKVLPNQKRIILSLQIDTNFVPVMEYFEIFTERMVYCRQAADSLGYQFGLVINRFKLL